MGQGCSAIFEVLTSLERGVVMNGTIQRSVTEAGHEIIPGIKTSHFLKAAEDDGFLWFAMIFVALMQESIFALGWRGSKASDLTSTMDLFFETFFECEESKTREQSKGQCEDTQDRNNPNGYSHQLEALSNLWSAYYPDDKPFNLRNFSEMYGANYKMENIGKFKLWLAKFFLERTDACIWRPGNGNLAL